MFSSSFIGRIELLRLLKLCIFCEKVCKYTYFKDIKLIFDQYYVLFSKTQFF